LSKNDIQSGSGSKKLSKNPDPRLRKSGSGTTLKSTTGTCFAFNQTYLT